MSTATTRSGDRPAVFVQQLHRAAAQRGKLDPVYQDLSDHWTQILQRLYPVWALIGPGLSDPGHIEIHSRTIYLDSETLLGPRAEIAAGRLPQRAILRCFGVAIHETLHAKHTKRWAIEHDIALSESADPADRQLAIDRRLLEEPRMEAHGVRKHPPGTVRGRFIRRALETAVIDVILPAFAGQLLGAATAGRPLTRDMAGRASVYLQARTHYGILAPAVLDPVRVVWRQVLGGRDLAALDELFARVIWIDDGDLDTLDRAARDYRAIIGAADPPPADGQSQGPGQDNGAGDGPAGQQAGEDRSTGDGSPSAGSLGEAIGQALAQAAEGQLEQLDEDLDLQQVLEQAAGRDGRTPTRGRARGSATGLPTGRMPDRGVDRPPAPDEIQHARSYATRLRQALTHGTRTIDKRTPGGRFDGRAYTRAQAQRQTGKPVTSHPWRITRQVRAPIEEPHVGLVIDTSGSMGAYEYALGPICWILTDGLRQIGGRCATALFGNSAALLSDGTRPLALVPGIRTGGGTAFAGDAIELVSDQLEITNPRRPRFLYVLSDGGWADTRAGVERIRWLAEHDVPTIHLSIAIEPLGVECDRIHVITDPAQALDQIAADTVAALRARTRPRTHNQPR
jgi:Mg-chelatase subunit ChlD